MAGELTGHEGTVVEMVGQTPPISQDELNLIKASLGEGEVACERCGEVYTLHGRCPRCDCD